MKHTDNAVNRIILLYQEFFRLKLVLTRVDCIEDPDALIELDFRLLHYYGYDIVYDPCTDTFYATDSSQPVDDRFAIVENGLVPLRVLETIREEDETRWTGSAGTYKRKNVLKKRRIV